MVRQCIICSKDFDARGNTKTCSLVCRRARAKERQVAFNESGDRTEYQREYQRLYRNSPARKASAQKYRDSKKAKEYQKAYQKEYRRRRKEANGTG